MSSLPPTSPLQRLQVTDGLLLTAERWQVAHSYHRQRQNLHFQAQQQPGIVSGLGVCPVAAPMQVAAQYRDGRWLQVQPGMAIDQEGNPIVVPRPVEYRIAAEPGAEPLQVYLVLSFVDPDRLDRRDGTHVVQETFRLEEKVVPPDATEIELCRIWLQAGTVQVRSPLNGFAPAPNELDLRYRPRMRDRPKGTLNLGYLTVSSDPVPRTAVALSGLLDALDGLYPSLQGEFEPGHIALRQGSQHLLERMQMYDLLHLTRAHCQQLQESDTDLLRSYLATGGVLLVEAAAAVTPLGEMFQVWAEVMKTLTYADTGEYYNELKSEQLGLESAMAAELEELIAPIRPLIPQEALTLAGLKPADYLDQQHPLRTTPFRFGLFPALQRAPLVLFNWGGVVVSVGELSTAWGSPEAAFMSRETIRSAQELGINLLHFAWQRRQWQQSMTPFAPVEPSPAPGLSRSSRLDAIFDQLDR